MKAFLFFSHVHALNATGKCFGEGWSHKLHSLGVIEVAILSWEPVFGRGAEMRSLECTFWLFSLNSFCKLVIRPWTSLSISSRTIHLLLTEIELPHSGSCHYIHRQPHELIKSLIEITKDSLHENFFIFLACTCTQRNWQMFWGGLKS